jgi:hypothetical protein
MGQHHEIHLGDEGSVANALRIVMRNYFSTQLLAGAARMAEEVVPSLVEVRWRSPA